MKRLPIFLLSIICIFFMGCIDIVEEVWIYNGTAGRWKLMFSIDKNLYNNFSPGSLKISTCEQNAREARLELKKNPNIEDFTFQSYNSSGYVNLVWDLKVKDVTKLKDDLEIFWKKCFPDTGEDSPYDWKDDFNITKLSNGNLQFSYVIKKKLIRALTEKEKKEQKQAKDSGLLNDHYYTIKLNSLNSVIDENTNGKVIEDGKAIQWQMSLENFFYDNTIDKEWIATIPIANFPPVKYSWGINYGIFNDDIWCKNESDFTLTNVVIEGDIQTSSGTKKIKLETNKIKSKETYTWVDAISVPQNSTGKAVLVCDQNR